MHVTDLSIPVRDGEGRLGLETVFETPYTFAEHGWRGSTVRMFCHMATHVDAPSHFIERGAAIDAAPLGKLMGPAAKVELADHFGDRAITADTLEERGRHVQGGDIVILATGWTDAHWGTPEFWTDGPYLAPDAADWLVERGVKAVVYDFAEEFEVRLPDFRGEDCVVHHKLLGWDIYNIEYAHNLVRIRAPRLTVVALPLKLVGLDGAPARVVAIEGVEMPAEFTVEG